MRRGKERPTLSGGHATNALAWRANCRPARGGCAIAAADCACALPPGRSFGVARGWGRFDEIPYARGGRVLLVSQVGWQPRHAQRV